MMPIVNALIAAALESTISSLVIGLGLVIVVGLALKFLAPVNAATRAMAWTLTLIALPLIQVLYIASHLMLPAKPIAVLATAVVRQPLNRAQTGPRFGQDDSSTKAASTKAASTKAASTQAASTQAASTQAASTQAASTQAASTQAASTQAASTQPVGSSEVPLRYQLRIPTPPTFPQDALALYAIVVSLLLGRLLISYLRLCVLRRRTEAAPAAIAARLDGWLARCPTTRPVRLRLSHGTRSPLAIGWLKPMIVMPAIFTLELSAEEFDNLGVHELAHLRRHDDWINLLQHVLEAFLFFHPAAYYAGRKLNLEREIACDDWVVSAQESKSYARCLAKVVELRRYQRGALLLSSGAFFGKYQILKRVESLLDKTRNSATRISSFTVIALTVIVVAAVTEISHFPSVIAFTQEERNSTHIRWSDDSRDFRINYRGDITFAPDEQSISALSPGGFLTIDEAKNWSHRHLDVRPGPNGVPEASYSINGRERPLDGVGSAWAASAYLFLMRDAGLDSEARVTRILARRGVVGVLEEVDLIHSDRVKCDYLNHLMEQAILTASDLQRLADCARKISSDNDKAEFLLAHRSEFAVDGLRTSYFRAVNSVNSDNDRRRLLTGMLETDGESPETARLVGLSAKTMNSDNDKAEVLLSIPTTASGETHCALLKAARTIQSDNDKARVLQEASYVESTLCRDAYFAVVNLIQSDNDKSGVLQNLLKQAGLEPATYLEVANSAKGLHSDNDKANVLTMLSAHYTEAPFFDAANTIDSSNDRARVLQAVMANAPSKAVLLQVISSASTLGADNEKTDILINIAKQSSDFNVRTALQQACEKLTSDNDYRRVASALFEQRQRSGEPSNN